MQIIPFTPAVERTGEHALETAPAVRTDAIYIVFTAIDETLAAVRVAAALGRAMRIPLILIHFRPVPYPLSIDAPVGVSPVETETFVERLRTEGIEVRVRVYLCRSEEQAIAMAFRRHSVVVVGGLRRWWPTPSERLRRRLENAGHLVVFVDAVEHGACGPRDGEPSSVSVEEGTGES